MFFSVLFFLGVAFFASTVQAITSADVITLSEKDFDEAIEFHQLLLVEFYAPW
jgi:hypothetical protein